MIAITQLSDSQLVADLKSAVEQEREKMTLVLEYLREVDRRRLYADYGCATLWEFCTKELRYSEGAAQRRTTAMKLLRELPELKADLLSGKQNLSSLVQAEVFFRLEEKVTKLTTEEKREVLKSTQDLSVREGKKKLIAMSSFPVELARPEKETPLDDEHTELKIVVDSKLLAKLNRIKALRSHASPRMKYADLLEYMADETLKQLEKVPARKSPPTPAVAAPKLSPPTPAVATPKLPPSTPAVTTPKLPPPTPAVATPKLSPPTPAVTKRVPVPAALRRQIHSTGVCGHRNPDTGQLCGAKHFLEIDHIIPVALGGTNHPENLQLRCRAHNQRRAFQQGLLKVPKPRT